MIRGLSAAEAQNNIQLTVRWNSTAVRYEVYAKPNFTNSNFTWGTSQISVVTPSSVPNSDLIVSSVNAGVWADRSNAFAPAAQSNSDFHGVVSDGNIVNFVANQELLIFTFTLPGGGCIDGLRLFVNGVDPNSGASGMAGGDFNNSIDYGALTEGYHSNYNNTGTVCNECNVTAPELSTN